MRRMFLVFALVALTAGALSAGAFAKEGGVELSSTPSGLGPGDPWNGTLTVFSAEGFAEPLSPSITIRNLGTGETQTFPATSPAKVPTTANSRSFVFEVVFPRAGRYSYTARDGVSEREYEFPIVRIVGSTTAPVLGPISGQESAFPLWPVVGSVGGAAVLALATFLAIRNRRFAH